MNFSKIRIFKCLSCKAPKMSLESAFQSLSPRYVWYVCMSASIRAPIRVTRKRLLEISKPAFPKVWAAVAIYW